MRATGREAFTIIEILVVITIILMLAGALFVAGTAVTRKMCFQAAEAEMQMVLAALDDYYDDYNAYPARNVPSSGRTGGLIAALQESGGGWRYGCQFREAADMYWIDPWGTEFSYSLSGGKPYLKSNGPDTATGTVDSAVDDITAR